jgi:hypothetical protein
MNLYKYGRTFHFPFSEGIGNDDKIIKSFDAFQNEEVVITIKKDGENTSIYPNTFHARSIDSRHHPSRDWIASFAASIGYKIPENCRICGENVFAKHSIEYNDLESYFYGFSFWEDKKCLSWDDTLFFFKEIGIVPVKEIYRGGFDLTKIKKLTHNIDTNKDEGFVCRLTKSFDYDDFSNCVVKWVRKNHVQTESHWMHSNIITNKLKNETSQRV